MLSLERFARTVLSKRGVVFAACRFLIKFLHNSGQPMLFCKLLAFLVSRILSAWSVRLSRALLRLTFAKHVRCLSAAVPAADPVMASGVRSRQCPSLYNQISCFYLTDLDNV